MLNVLFQFFLINICSLKIDTFLDTFLDTYAKNKNNFKSHIQINSYISNMKTCIISRRVKIFNEYIQDADKFEEDLTINGSQSDFCNRKPMVCFKKTRDAYIVPKTYGLKYIKEYKLPHKYSIGNGESMEIPFNGSLRQNQVEVVDLATKTLNECEGVTLHLYCGFGKTCISIYLACKLKMKTLIFVHTKALALQWEERINEFARGSSIGYIRQNVFDIENKDFVIASMQTICSRDFESKLFDSFGLSIWDEAHHVAAETLSKCIHKAGSKYRIGLTATPARKDKFENVIFNAIGDLSSSVERSNNTQELHVEVVHITDGPSDVRTMWRGGKECLNIAKMINELSDSIDRTSSIVKSVIQKYNEGRHVLVISDRRDHLKIMAAMLEKEHVTEYGYLVGGMKDDDNSNAHLNKIIFATYAYCSEGVDISSLDTVFLTTPRRDVIQTVGRILRNHPDKKTPLVVDFIDCQQVFKNQSYARNRYYKTLGGIIFHLNQDLTLKTKKRKVESNESNESKSNKTTMITAFFKK